MQQEFFDALGTIAGAENISIDEPMSRHTTFRVGGPADVLIGRAAGCAGEIISYCASHGIPYFVMGNGSNLLVSDAGIRGVVIEMLDRTDDISVDGNIITAGAGMLLSRTAHFAAKSGLSGMEFASGIPGTLGGAVVMNAGAYGGEMKDIVTSVTAVDESGAIVELSHDELDFGYRTSAIAKRHLVVTRVSLSLAGDDVCAITSRMAELNKQRTAKQPLEYPSAGSTFKRPQGYFAGKLIMDAGLRGYSVGEAAVSEKHCGFVINKGGAKACDIKRLMDDVVRRVYENSGVTLEPEVKMIGEF